MNLIPSLAITMLALTALSSRATAEPVARTQGMHFVEYTEGDGPIIFEHACKLGLEGIVSKRRDLGYISGNCKSWLKIKNPTAPAMLRLQEDGA
jgi:ATP-dependent DNA ligase